MNPILERNVASLLRRAYVPALPAPAFRERLHATFVAEVRRTRLEPRSPARVRGARWPLWAGLAAAAVLLFLLGGPLLAPREGATSRAELLARGRTALSRDGGAWRAVEAEERARGLDFERGTLEVATAAAEELAIRVTDGELLLAAATRVRLTDEPERPFAFLEEGELALERRASTGTAWSVATGAGSVVLEHGRAELARERDELLVRLVEGAGRFVGPAGPTTLVPGSATRFVAGLPASTTVSALESSDPSAARQLVVENVEQPPAAPSGERPTTTLVGSVAAGGAPVTEFRVGLLPETVGNEIRFPATKSYASDDGGFRWDAVTPGRYRIFVHAEGHPLFDGGMVELGGIQSTQPLPVELAPGGFARGHVLDARTRNPIPGAIVLSEHDTPTHGLPFHAADLMVFGWLPVRARTLADGAYELGELNAGRHVLQVSAEGYATSWVTIEIDGTRTTDVPTVLLDSGGAVEGLVTRQDGSPWVGTQLLVVLLDKKGRPLMSLALARTDGDGRYRVADLPPELLLVVHSEGQDELKGPAVRPVEIRPGESATVDFLGEVQGITLRGRLLDAAGRPVPNQNIGLFDLTEGGFDFEQVWEATSTLSNGSFVFEGLKPGRHLLFSVRAMGEALQLVTELELPDWPEVELELRLGVGRIAGQVRGAAAGAPQPGSVLILERRGPEGKLTFAGNTYADDRGAYSFRDLAPGAYVVTAHSTDEHLGFQRSRELTVLADPDAEARQDFDLQPGGSVLVTVVDEAGTPVPYAYCVFFDEDRNELTFAQFPRTDEAGLHAARGVRPGRYEVLVDRDGFTRGTADVEARAGTVVEVRVVIRPLEDDSGTAASTGNEEQE